jgi:ubiquinone/menaquinone biosynthesis C-methylase UbiE
VGTVEKSDPAYPGQAIYSRWFLSIYDALAYGVNSPLVWRCPKVRLVELYNANVSARHLDVGVATGRLLDECEYPVEAPEITLMDLNQNCLDAASRRLARYTPLTHQANALEPWNLPRASYESVGMSMLLHCLPGAMPEKRAVFEHAREVLAPGGVLFGATILGKGVQHNRLTRHALRTNNRRGVLANLDDSAEDLDAALARVFASHDIQVQGTVALFAAHR